MRNGKKDEWERGGGGGRWLFNLWVSTTDHSGVSTKAISAVNCRNL